MRSFITYLTALLMLTACMSYGKKVDQDQVSKFVKGKTTYSEVIQKLGKPTNSIVNSDGTRTLTYVYMQYQINPAYLIPIAGILAQRGQTENTAVFLQFDSNSILKDYSASEGGSTMGAGVLSGQKQ